MHCQTMMGTMSSKQAVTLHRVTLPEFTRTDVVESITLRVAPTYLSTGKYDLILGRDVLSQMGLDMCFSDRTIRWNDVQRPMLSTATIHEEDNVTPLSVDLRLNFMLEQEDDNDDTYVSDIKPSEYKVVDIDAVVAKCKHLTEKQHEQLAQLIHKYKKLLII